MQRDVWSKLSALTFALAAPSANVLLTLAWAAGTGPFMVERGPLLVQGSLASLALVALVAALFVWRRRRSIGGLEVFLLWLGCALSFAWTFGIVAATTPTLIIALQLSPYLFDAILWGLAIALAAGLALAFWWFGRKWA